MLDLAQEMLQAPIVEPSARAAELAVSGWPCNLDTWFMRCVNRDAEARFTDADHARAALFPLLGFEAPPPTRSDAGLVPALAGAASSSSTYLVVLAAVFAVLAAAGALALIVL